MVVRCRRIQRKCSLDRQSWKRNPLRPYLINLSPRTPPRTLVHNNVPITYTSGEQVEVYRFSIPFTVLVPATALFLQAWLPRQFPFLAMFDLPLLVTIFFSIARRNPISGLLTGAVIGVFQDALTGLQIGIYGIAKTVVGYGASSLGVKLDVENAGARVLVTLVSRSIRTSSIRSSPGFSTAGRFL